MNKISLFILFLISPLIVLATHNRAGEITYRHLSGFKYEITITTFTYTESPADREYLDVSWGDDEISTAYRQEETFLPDYYKKNIYKATHEYPSAGTYEIIVEDPNRNFCVGNIPNSVNVVFAIKTVLQIGHLGPNNTPELLNYPIDKAALNQVFIHNPAAWDPDGDSLSYKLTTCLESGGVEISDYSLPPFDNELYVDPVTGDLIWDSPILTGIYNVAILIEEWRDGHKIGTIIRDMQIEVVESNNIPPIIKSLKNICVEAGDTLVIKVEATDPNGDIVTIGATGGPFQVDNSPAEYYTPPFSPPGEYQFTGIFTWATNCSHVRKYPYQVTFRAIDDHPLVNLVDIENVQITVIALAPDSLTLEPTNKTIQLSWDTTPCQNAIGYDIYRRINSYGFIPDECETGIPAYTGYNKIARVDSFFTTTFLDTDDGNGLRQGIEYCYMIDAIFADGAESFASEEVCGHLKRGIPIITNVSVDSTDQFDGEIYLAWSKPLETDTLGPGPFVYHVYRSEGIWGQNLTFVDSLEGINDTIYHDSQLNTFDFPYSYKVEMWNNEPGNRFLVGSPQIASSIYIEINAADEQLELVFENNTPWIDSLYIIKRRNNISMEFDSIGYSDSAMYIDQGLSNGTNYCYLIEGIGTYHIRHIIHPLINFSQINCAEPIDTVPPCQPALSLSSNCDEFNNYLSWFNPNDSCSDDAVAYNLYYTDRYEGEFELLTRINSPIITNFTHNFTDSSFTMAGCYAVTAIDSFENESEIIKRICIDDCNYYELPNVFTPNNDQVNNIYTPLPYRFVEKVDMKIFNRWGNLVFTTEDPDINWDGTHIETKARVPDGVYYYICDVYTHRLYGLEHHTLVGFIHIFSGDSKPIND